MLSKGSGPPQCANPSSTPVSPRHFLRVGLGLLAVVSALVLAVGFALVCRVPRGVASAQSDDFDSLVAQLRGDACSYRADNADWERGVERARCRSVGVVGGMFDRGPTAQCKIDAARCLQERAPRDGDAVPALIEALLHGEDVYDTGDGELYVRASYAQALGIIGDPRAIDPLVRTLDESSSLVARTAAAHALRTFGPRAKTAAPRLIAILRDEPALARCEEDCARLRMTRAGARSCRREAPPPSCAGPPPRSGFVQRKISVRSVSRPASTAKPPKTTSGNTL